MGVGFGFCVDEGEMVNRVIRGIRKWCMLVFG